MAPTSKEAPSLLIPAPAFLRLLFVQPMAALKPPRCCAHVLVSKTSSFSCHWMRALADRLQGSSTFFLSQVKALGVLDEAVSTFPAPIVCPTTGPLFCPMSDALTPMTSCRPGFSLFLWYENRTVLYSFHTWKMKRLFFIVASPALSCVLLNPTIMVVIGRFSPDLSPFALFPPLDRARLQHIFPPFTR